MLLACPSWEKPVKPLKNIGDCYALAESFEIRGWSTVVLTGPEATAKMIIDTINETQIRNFAFYYGGHGVAFNGKNILVTAGVGPKNIDEGLELDKLIELVRKKALTATFYLDSCRTDFLPASAMRSLGGLDTAVGFLIPDIPDSRSMNEKSNVNVFYASSDKKPAYDGPDGGIFSVVLKAVLDSAPARGIRLTEIAENVMRRVSNWVGPNSERQKPVLVLGSETLVGDRLPKHKSAPPPPPALEVIPGVESPAVYDGLFHNGSLILTRPRRDLDDIHVYNASSKEVEPGKTSTPIGWFKVPATAGKDVATTTVKDATTYSGQFAYDGRQAVPARLMFDGTRIVIAFETKIAPTPVPTAPCVPEPPPSTPGKRAKALPDKRTPQPGVKAPEPCVEPVAGPSRQEPKKETTELQYLDRRSLNIQR